MIMATYCFKFTFRCRKLSPAIYVYVVNFGDDDIKIVFAAATASSLSDPFV